MGLSVQQTATIFILVLVSTSHPTTGGGHDPLLVLDGYEDDGIRLECFSQRPFSEVRLLWTDGRGDNVTVTPVGNANANANASIVLKRGSRNPVSCKIIDKVLGTSTESSVAVADVFFPVTSPWLAAFVVILILSGFLVIAAIYKLRKNNKTIARENDAQKEIQKEIDQLNEEWAEEQDRFQKENQDMLIKIEKVESELEFRRAQSKAVPIALDQTREHPALVIQHQTRVKSRVASNAAAIATRGFSADKHYWEVEVWDKTEWELGILGEETRNSLKTHTIDSLPNAKILGLRFYRGEFSVTGGEGGRNHKPCGVVGVFLDRDLRTLSFFDVEGKRLLECLSCDFSGSLYPFFSPGSDGKWLGVRPVRH